MVFTSNRGGVGNLYRMSVGGAGEEKVLRVRSTFSRFPVRERSCRFPQMVERRSAGYDGKELFYIGLDERLMAVPIRLPSNDQAVEASVRRSRCFPPCGGSRNC
jgi:hypothetical protein